MKTTLLIMAAGIGSRFGGGIKQLEPVGERDELIIDYSIHDAIQAGFNQIIFVIRREIQQDFQDRIGNRVQAVCDRLGVEVRYAYQDLMDIPEEYTIPEGRKKPWGTGHAVLAARDLIREPFAVINADDYYGKEAFRQIHDYLQSAREGCCMAGFQLQNTLSDHGGVTRGICQVEKGMVTSITETSNIVKVPGGGQVNGITLRGDTIVSMNMWGFPGKEGEKPQYIRQLEQDFYLFFQYLRQPLTQEYLLPIHIGWLLEQGRISVRMLETGDQWFGVTYKEDKQMVIENFHRLIREGVYEKDLYSDL